MTKKLQTKEEIEEIKEDLGKIKDIVVLAETKGGKVLVQSLVDDIISIVDVLCSKHKTLTLQEFTGLSAELKTKVDMAKVISNAKSNANFLKDLLENSYTADE